MSGRESQARTKRAQYQFVHDAALPGLCAVPTSRCKDPSSVVPSHSLPLWTPQAACCPVYRAVWGSRGCHDDKQCSSWTSSLLLPAKAEHIPIQGFCSRTKGSALRSRSQNQGHFLTVTHQISLRTLINVIFSLMYSQTHMVGICLNEEILSASSFRRKDNQHNWKVLKLMRSFHQTPVLFISSS